MAHFHSFSSFVHFRNKDIEARDSMDQSFFNQYSSCLNLSDQIRQSDIKSDFFLVVKVNR